MPGPLSITDEINCSWLIQPAALNKLKPISLSEPPVENRAARQEPAGSEIRPYPTPLLLESPGDSVPCLESSYHGRQLFLRLPRAAGLQPASRRPLRLEQDARKRIGELDYSAAVIARLVPRCVERPIRVTPAVVDEGEVDPKRHGHGR